MNDNSILPPELTGVAFITGPRGVGKSFLASQADLPSRIAFFDFESKGRGIDSQLHFGLYRALNQEGRTPIEMYDLMINLFENLEQDRYTVAILDNISPFELALGAEVARNAKMYAEHSGMNTAKVKSNAYGQGHACVNLLIGRTCALLHSRGVKLIIATSHIKHPWVHGQPVTGKWRKKGHDEWQNLSILTVILVPGDNPPTPDAIVQKEQLGTITLDEANLTQEQIEAMMRGEIGHTISRRLPRRIPGCTFQKIRQYLVNPASLNSPESGEEYRHDEAQPFEEDLTKEQLALVTLALQQQEREEPSAPVAVINPQSLIAKAQAQAQTQVSPEVSEAIAKAKELAKSGLDTGAVRAKLKELGYAVPVAARAMREVDIPF